MKDLHRDIYEKLFALQWHLRRLQMSRYAEYGFFSDVEHGQGRVLALLKIQPEIGTKDLAYLLGIRQQSLNELLRRLEKGGYVERKSSDEDRRVTIVHLTEKGKGVQQPENDYQSIFGCLSQEELSNLALYLDRILDSIEERLERMEPAFNEDELAWMEGARRRMGTERFDEMMRLGVFGRGTKGGFGTMRWNRRGSGEFEFERDERGPAPRDLPGAERFDPDYDGPMPEGRGRFPWQRKRAGDDAES